MQPWIRADALLPAGRPWEGSGGIGVTATQDVGIFGSCGFALALTNEAFWVLSFFYCRSSLTLWPGAGLDTTALQASCAA